MEVYFLEEETMSKLIKCAVCERIFERIADHESYGARLMGEEMLSFLKVEDYSPFRIDLCPECAKPLKKLLSKWWKKEKK